MNTEIQSNELIQVVEQSGLEIQTSDYIKERFLPFFEQAQEWKEKAAALVVTDASQVREMQIARQARLALKEIRINADKTRKALKEDSLRYGKAVQGVYNVIEYLIAPIEKHLEQQEKFVEIQEAKRKAELKAAREIELEPFMEFVPYLYDLGEMPEADYQKLLTGAKLQWQAKLDAESKAEAERIERERLDNLEHDRRIEIAPYAQFVTGSNDLRNMPDHQFQTLMKNLQKAKADYEIEQERIRQENERLRKEREAELAKIEAERKREREAAEAKLKVEREAKAKLEAELKAKRESEEKAKKEAEAKAKAEREAAERAAKAPRKERLNDWVDTFSIGCPEGMHNDKTVIDISQKFSAFINWAKTQINNI